MTVAPARDRILESAYELFSTRGIRAVGIDEVIERAAVAPNIGHAIRREPAEPE